MGDALESSFKFPCPHCDVMCPTAAHVSSHVFFGHKDLPSEVVKPTYDVIYKKGDQNCIQVQLGRLKDSINGDTSGKCVDWEGGYCNFVASITVDFLATHGHKDCVKCCTECYSLLMCYNSFSHKSCNNKGKKMTLAKALAEEPRDGWNKDTVLATVNVREVVNGRACVSRLSVTCIRASCRQGRRQLVYQQVACYTCLRCPLRVPQCARCPRHPRP